MARRRNAALEWLTDTRARVLGLICWCGGQVVIHDLYGITALGQYRYEASCQECKRCDPNRYPTITEAIDGSRAYFPSFSEEGDMLITTPEQLQRKENMNKMTMDILSYVTVAALLLGFFLQMIGNPREAVTWLLFAAIIAVEGAVVRLYTRHTTASSPKEGFFQ